MTDEERWKDIAELVGRAKTYTPEENADIAYWPSLYHQDVKWLLAKIVRLTAERDKERDYVATLNSEIDRLRDIAHSAEADLAAAQTTLEFVVPVMKGYPKNTIGEALYSMATGWGEAALARLGTEEALRAVREAQEFINKPHGIGSMDKRAEKIAARLKAVFGE